MKKTLVGIILLSVLGVLRTLSLAATSPIIETFDSGNNPPVTEGTTWVEDSDYCGSVSGGVCTEWLEGGPYWDVQTDGTGYEYQYFATGIARSFNTVQVTGVAGSDFVVSVDFVIDNYTYDDSPNIYNHLRLGFVVLGGYWCRWVTIHEYQSDIYEGYIQIRKDGTLLNKNTEKMVYQIGVTYTMNVVGTYDASGNLTLTMSLSDGTNTVMVSTTDTSPLNGDDFGLLAVSYHGTADVDFDNFAVNDLAETVEIDIKPGDYPNAINLGLHGLVPVAILSDENFDATTVNPDTVELAGANVEVKVKGKSNKYMAHAEDVNGDGLVDLLVQVATANLDPDSLQDGWAVLTAETFDGRLIEGSDEITIVPPEN